MAVKTYHPIESAIIIYEAGEEASNWDEVNRLIAAGYRYFTPVDSETSWFVVVATKQSITRKQANYIYASE